MGWRSGGLLTSILGEDALDLSYGRPDFQVGDSFLIWDGSLDQFGKGAYWLGPCSTFRRTGVFRMNTQPVRADLFYRESDADRDYNDLGSVSLEYITEASGTCGVIYFHVLDAGAANYSGH